MPVAGDDGPSLSKRDTRSLYWSALLFRFALGLVAWASLGVMNVDFIEDALYYEELGAGVAADWLAGRQSFWLQDAMASGTRAWVVVAAVASIYYLFGGLRVLPVVIAAYCALSALTPVLTYRIAREVGGDRRAALIAGRLVAFSPAFVFWGGALYKEGLIFLLMNLIVYHTLRLQHAMSLRSVILVVGSVSILLGIRFYLAFILAAGVLVGLLFGKPKSEAMGASAVMLLRQTALVCVVVAALAALGMGQRFETVVPTSVELGFDWLTRTRQGLAGTASGYLPETTLMSPRQTLEFLPVGATYFLTVPLPWQIGRLRQNLTIPETLFWICLYPFIAYGMWRTFRRNRGAAVLIVVVTGLAVLLYGAFVGNIGTAYRMRSQIWLLWAVFAGVGWSAWLASRTVSIPGATTELTT